MNNLELIFPSVADVEEFKLNEYTLEHMRAFGMYNHLHLDPWYEDSVLFIDGKGRVLSLTVILVSYEIIPNRIRGRDCFPFCYIAGN